LRDSGSPQAHGRPRDLVRSAVLPGLPQLSGQQAEVSRHRQLQRGRVRGDGARPAPGRGDVSPCDRDSRLEGRLRNGRGRRRARPKRGGARLPRAQRRPETDGRDRLGDLARCESVESLGTDRCRGSRPRRRSDCRGRKTRSGDFEPDPGSVRHEGRRRLPFLSAGEWLGGNSRDEGRNEMKRLFAALSLKALPTVSVEGRLPASAAHPRPPKLRLPATARPIAYDLDLTISPEKETFSGAIDIDIELSEPTALLWLHARELTITEASLADGKRRKGVRIVPGGEDFVGF